MEKEENQSVWKRLFALLMEHCERPKRSGNTQTRVSHHEAFQHPPPPPATPHTHTQPSPARQKNWLLCASVCVQSEEKSAAVAQERVCVCLCTACGHTGLSEECFEKSGGKVSLSPSPPLSQILQSVFLWSADKKKHTTR